jgi:hypothetical protein
MKLTHHWSLTVLVAAFVGCFALTATAWADAYSTAVLADNPFGYWRMQETEGDGVNSGSDTTTLQHSADGITLDFAGPSGDLFPGFDSNNNSTYYSGNTAGNGFSRIGDETKPADYAYDMTGALTVETWIKAADVSTTGNRVIMADFHNTNNHRAFMLYQNGSSLRFSVSGDGATAITLNKSGALTADTWLHVVGVFRPSEAIELYLNGELISSNTSDIPASLFNSKYSSYVGAQWTSYNSGSWFQGGIDEAAIYDTALSAEQIKNHYDAATVVPEPGSLTLITLGGLLFARRRR